MSIDFNPSTDNLILDFDFSAVILDEEIEIAPKFIVKEKKNNGLFNGKQYEIDAGGEINSPRKKRDGIVLFGPPLSSDETQDYENDIVTNLSNKKTSLKHYFAIYYSREKASYRQGKIG